MRFRILLLLYAILANVETYAALPASESLCTESEQAVFSCTIGRKTATLCASEAVTANDGYMRYSFGVKGKRQELEYPIPLQKPIEAFFWNSNYYSHGGFEYVTFKIGAYVYIVYDVRKAFSETENDTGAGIFVKRGDKLVANMHCKEYSPLNRLHDLVRPLGLKPSPFGNPPAPYDSPNP
jgi:hypothetical protein